MIGQFIAPARRDCNIPQNPSNDLSEICGRSFRKRKYKDGSRSTLPISHAFSYCLMSLPIFSFVLPILMCFSQCLVYALFSNAPSHFRMHTPNLSCVFPNSHVFSFFSCALPYSSMSSYFLIPLLINLHIWREVGGKWIEERRDIVYHRKECILGQC